MPEKCVRAESKMFWNGALLTLAVLAVVLRFLFIDRSPPGFFIDEAHHATVSFCLADQGTDADDRPLPLFPQALAGGELGAPFAYGQAAWSMVFGPSIRSMRSFVAFMSALAVIGLYLIGTYLCDRRCGLWTALAAALSPWSFHFARINWDSPLVACFIVWGLVFLLRNPRSYRGLALSALCFCLAIYTYPAGRIAAPLVAALATVYLLWQRKLGWRHALLFAVIGAVFCLPIGMLLWNGDLFGRFHLVGIFSADYLRSLGREYTAAAVAKTYLENMGKHLSADFLIFKGDGNLRHASGFAGMLGVFDLAGLALLVPLGIIARWTGAREGLTPHFRGFVFFALLGLLAGMSSAALTWEGIPHALRSPAAWPFAALIAGVAMNYLTARVPVLTGPAIAVVTAGFIWFAADYFSEYPHRAAGLFDQNLQLVAQRGRDSGSWEPVREQWRAGPMDGGRDYYRRVMRYYLIAYGGYDCRSSWLFFD